MKAIWNGSVVAESPETVVVDGNHYFPADSIRQEFFIATEQTSVCGWKGEASYYDLDVEGKKNPGAAWTYKSPKDAAAEIRGAVAFWKGVDVTE